MMEIAIFKYDLTMISSSLWLDKEIHKEITGIGSRRGEGRLRKTKDGGSGGAN